MRQEPQSHNSLFFTLFMILMTSFLASCDLSKLRLPNSTEGDGSDGNAPGDDSDDTAPSDSLSADNIIGIPAPTFGLSETNQMYDGKQFNFGLGLENYRNSGFGPYTHYIDNTHPQATDTNNTFGTAGKPRRTIPQTLPAGAVVELHGGPYASTQVIRFGGPGTSTSPIFVRGTDATQKIQLGMIELTGQYVILENILLDHWSIYNDCGIDLSGAINHISIRHCEVRNGPDATTSAIAIGGGASSIVISDCKIHDNGDWQATYDQDHHGIGVGAASYVWILKNTFFHNSGDGVQVNGTLDTHHIYLGGNVSYQNKQTGMWTKKASDVIFSQNTIHDHVPSGSSPGACMGFQYGPERVWFLFNHLYNCTFGIMGASDGASNGDSRDGDYSYVIGNLIHDIHAETPADFKPGTAWSDGYAIHVRGTSVRSIVGNTIYHSDAGIAGTYGGEFHIRNNIISQLTGPNARHIFIENPISSASSAEGNLFDTAALISWDSSPLSLLSFQNTKGLCNSCLNASAGFLNTNQFDFHLRSDSPARAKAASTSVYDQFFMNYGLSIRKDFDGIDRATSGPDDTGAYVFR